MPRLEIDYSKTIIYKLCCLDNNVTDIYIGHTTNFRMRKSQHKSSCKTESNKKTYNLKVYQCIRKNGGWDNWNMVQIEEYPCKNIREAGARETHWMKELNSTLNCVLAFNTRSDKLQRLNKWKKSEKGINYKKSEKNIEKHRIQCKTWRHKKTAFLNELRCYNL